MESTNPICKQIDESLDAFHDDELSASEQAAVEAHIKTCQHCSAKLADIDRLVATLRAMPRLDTPVALSSKLDSIIDQQNKVVALRSRVWKPVAAVAAVAAIVFGVRMSTVGGGGEPLVAERHEAAPPAVQVAQAPVQIAQTPTKTTEKPVVPDATSKSTDPTTEPTPAPPGPADLTKKMIASKTPDAASPSVLTVPKNGDLAEVIASNHSSSHSPKSMPALRANGRTEMIAAAPITATEMALESSIDSEAIAELPTITNSFADAVGIETDEDGLYDIKM